MFDALTLQLSCSRLIQMRDSDAVKLSIVKRVDDTRIGQAWHCEPGNIAKRFICAERGCECLPGLRQEPLCFMRAPSVSDISQHHRIDALTAASKVRDRSFRRKFLAVPAKAEDLPALSHAAGLDVRLSELPDLLCVRRSVPLGDQQLERLSHDVVGLIAENEFG